MNEQPLKCLRCQGEMEQGFLPETIQGGALIGTWSRGVPRNTFWTGVQVGRGSDRLPLGAFRCQSCGLVELYASAEFEPK